MCTRLEHMTLMLKGGDAGVVAIENTPCGGTISMLYQFLFMLTSTRQPTPVVLSTDTAQISRAVLTLPATTNPRDTQVRKHGVQGVPTIVGRLQRDMEDKCLR